MGEEVARPPLKRCMDSRVWVGLTGNGAQGMGNKMPADSGNSITDAGVIRVCGEITSSPGYSVDQEKLGRGDAVGTALANGNVGG